MTRSSRTPFERATAARDTQARVVERLTRKLTDLNNTRTQVALELDAAQLRLEYLSENPDLTSEATAAADPAELADPAVGLGRDPRYQGG